MANSLTKKERSERKRIRLKGFDYASPRPYLITICANNKEALFVDDKLNQLIIDCLLSEKGKANFKLYVYCLMPNHCHLLLAPSTEKISISRFIGAFKSKTTRIAWSFGLSGKIWQERFHDRIVRKRESLKTIGQYILDNPVRKGLAQKWQDYNYLGLIDSWL
ncbi:MAG: transposase [bacterium]